MAYFKTTDKYETIACPAVGGMFPGSFRIPEIGGYYTIEAIEIASNNTFVPPSVDMANPTSAGPELSRELILGWLGDPFSMEIGATDPITAMIRDGNAAAPANVFSYFDMTGLALPVPPPPSVRIIIRYWKLVTGPC